MSQWLHINIHVTSDETGGQQSVNKEIIAEFKTPLEAASLVAEPGSVLPPIEGGYGFSTHHNITVREATEEEIAEARGGATAEPSVYV